MGEKSLKIKLRSLSCKSLLNALNEHIEKKRDSLKAIGENRCEKDK